MRTYDLSPERYAQWDSFVEDFGMVSPYYYTGWLKTISDSYGHRNISKMVIDDSEVLGVLPIFIVKGIFKKKLVSIPYCPYGGAICKTDSADNMLKDTLMELSEKYEVDHVELKTIEGHSDPFEVKSSFASFILSLEPSKEVLYQNLSKSTKRKINKAKNYDYSVKIESSEESLGSFYKLYREHLIRLGTPSVNFEFFRICKKYLDGHMDICSLYLDNELVSSSLFLRTNRYVVYDRGSTSQKFKHLNLNYVLFWELIQHYKAKGFKVLDFGRSVESSGTVQFKNSWRPEKIRLNYSYLVRKGQIPEYSQESSNRKLFTRIYKNVPRIQFVDDQLRRLFP